MKRPLPTVLPLALALLASATALAVLQAAKPPTTGTPAASQIPTGSSERVAANPPVSQPADATGQTTETEILATDGATFASRERIAVFTGSVRVNDQRFQLSCDKLTVFLNKTTETGGGGSAATPAPAAAATPAPLATGGGAAQAKPAGSSSSGGIDHAVAEGHVIIVQERSAAPGGEAKRSVGRGDWATFDNKTGDMTLKGTPSVEQNLNTHVATSPNTVMTLSRDNSLRTVGPSRTIITQRKSSELPGADNGSPLLGAPGEPARPAKKQRTGTPAPSPVASGSR